MPKLGFKHDGEPERRYAHISISDFSLRSEPPPQNGKQRRKNVLLVR